MNLYTRSYNPDWNRVVLMAVETCDKLSEDVTNDTLFKIILHEKGEIRLSDAAGSYTVKTPSLIILSDKEVSGFETVKNGSNRILYFNPTVVREEFTLEDLYGDVYEETFGKTIYQDYLLVRDFFKTIGLENKIFPLGMNEMIRVKNLIELTERELTLQYDGLWPCRSRSFLLELLFYVKYIFSLKDEHKEISEDEEIFLEISDYLNEHLGDDISLDDITGNFNINRNKLNSIFVSKTSKTWLNYLVDLRIDMAKSILSNTEIPIGEVSARVGYTDSNYFTKIFKKQTGCTPSLYRKHNS